MRILFITAYFPPCPHGWGYMRVCEQAANGLRALGHEVAVLTSTCGKTAGDRDPYPVYRLLEIDPDWNDVRPAAWQFFAGRRQRERQACEDLARLVARYQPDAIIICHAHGLSREMLRLAEREAGIPTIYYFANYLPEMPDEYLEYWRAAPSNPLRRLLKRPLAWLALRWLAREGKPVPLDYPHAICVSNYVRERLLRKGFIDEQSPVIRNGFDTRPFAEMGDRDRFREGASISCIIAGRLAPEKGVHTAIAAFARLQAAGELGALELTIMGDGPSDYTRMLRRMVANAALDERVRFDPAVPPGDMPAVLARHDLLLLPSEWHEPLAYSMLEAMAAGLLVVGTTTGGSGEMLRHGRSALTFDVADVGSLAGQLREVCRDPQRARTIARRGRDLVLEEVDVRRTAGELEQHLRSLLEQKDLIHHGLDA